MRYELNKAYTQQYVRADPHFIDTLSQNLVMYDIKLTNQYHEID